MGARTRHVGSDRSWLQRWVRRCSDRRRTARHEFDVDFLLFGAETNRLALFDPEAFDGFVALYADAYDAVKEVSPSTAMSTAFQLELMRGDAFLMGGSETRGPQWDLIDRFDGRLDLLGLTVYPSWTSPTRPPFPTTTSRRSPIATGFHWRSPRTSRRPSCAASPSCSTESTYASRSGPRPTVGAEGVLRFGWRSGESGSLSARRCDGRDRPDSPDSK